VDALLADLPLPEVVGDLRLGNPRHRQGGIVPVYCAVSIQQGPVALTTDPSRVGSVGRQL
jgi:hypothetical protein